MKKTILASILVAGMIFTGAVSSYAAGHCGQNAGLGVCGTNYVDSDGDGVCDNWASRYCTGNFVDADNDGICDNCGAAHHGANFVDANGDGVCDNCGSGRCGNNYVDANGDGI